jgi:hypothetical protein
VSDVGTAVSSGAVLGAVVVFLLQQFSAVSLSGFEGGTIYLVVGIVLGGIFGGLIGRQLLRRH